MKVALIGLFLVVSLGHLGAMENYPNGGANNAQPAQTRESTSLVIQIIDECTGCKAACLCCWIACCGCCS
jgi:hypothetical protein